VKINFASSWLVNIWIMWLESICTIEVFSAIIYSGQLSYLIIFFLNAVYTSDREAKSKITC